MNGRALAMDWEGGDRPAQVSGSVTGWMARPFAPTSGRERGLGGDEFSFRYADFERSGRCVATWAEAQRSRLKERT